jgi:hypothetical protein
VNNENRPLTDRKVVMALLESAGFLAVVSMVPKQDRSMGGRPRLYPDWCYVMFHALSSHFRSARAIDRFFEDEINWRLIRNWSTRHWPHNPELHAPATPYQRHHYRHMRDICVQTDVLATLREAMTNAACELAQQIGLCDPAGEGSWTHPSLDRTLHADGKVLSAPSRYAPDEPVVDRATGEVLRRRRSATGGSTHHTGTGETVYGSKFVIVGTRGDRYHQRVILDTALDPQHREAAVAVAMITNLVTKLPGVQAVTYDTAFRGTHLEQCLALGIIPIAPVAARSKKGDVRIAKDGPAGLANWTKPDGTKSTINIHAIDGGPHVITFDVDANAVTRPLPRLKTLRRSDANGYRWYTERAHPDGGTVTIRHHQDESDRKTGFNRAENLRIIAPNDPVYALMRGRRQDAEATNSAIEASLPWQRAHTYTPDRQLLDLVMFAVLNNAKTAAIEQRRQHATSEAA